MSKVTKINEAKASKNEQIKIRVAAYCRVSTDSDAQNESLEAQKKHYDKYIRSRGDWELADLYFDKGITGTKKDKRPDLLRMIEDCKAGKIDLVMLYVRDDTLKQAFVTIMNKLVFARRLILRPYEEALKNLSPDESSRRIQQLQTMIAENNEKRKR